MCQFDSGIWLHVRFHDFVDINKMEITQKSGMAPPWANGIASDRKCVCVPTHRKRLGRAEPVETESAERRPGRRSAMRLPLSSEGLCVILKADRRKPKENVPEIQTSVIKGAAPAAAALSMY